MESFFVDVFKSRLRVRHRKDPDRVLWQTDPAYPFVRVARGDASFREYGNPLGTFDIKENVTDVRTFERLESATVLNNGDLKVNGTLTNIRGNKIAFHLTFHSSSANQLQFTLGVESPDSDRWNRIFLRYASSPSEAFFGFGQQLTFFNQKGKTLPILVQEHGIGRGLPIITELVDLTYDGAGGNPRLTEAPAPHYITSQLRSLFLENKECSTFDMRAVDAVEIKLFAARMTGRILFGQTPPELIKEYSSYAGRMRPLPSWVHQGVIVAAQGGDGPVNAALSKLVAAGVPLAGLWVQDWSGIKETSAGEQVLWNWKLNRDWYKSWDSLVDKLSQQNARVMVYMNPFLVNNLCGRDEPPCPGALYAEAESKGHFIKQNGKTFVYKNSTITAAMFDLSNPDARAWIKQLIQTELIGNARASGWMAAFGEALPFNADLFENADPAVWHNHYAEAWSTLHRDPINKTDHGDDFLFWSRSGFTRSPGSSTAFWLGDQLQTWDEYDGIKTAVVGLLSGGMSGFSLLHSDTGGFVAARFKHLPIIARSPELLMRWMELNAFTAIFRTHEGLIPSISAQVTDPGPLTHLARFGQIYQLLSAYRKDLVKQASQSGYPVVRHLFLHYRMTRTLSSFAINFCWVPIS